jgi:hypothetical protein
MKTRVILAAVASFCALSGGKPLHGSDLLKMHISPLVAQAPGVITVRAVVDASDDNRGLEVMAQSPDFARRSTIDLDGRAAPTVNVFTFAHLPAGEYEISAALLGTNGVRATMTRTVLVMPSPGSRR